MDLIAKNSGGYQLVGRPQARAAWQPTDQVRPARVEVWWRYAGEVAAAARLIGMYAPGQVVQVPLNPGSDRDLIFSTVSRSSDGVRSVRELAEAREQTISFVVAPKPAGGDLTGFYPDPTIKADAVTYAKLQNVSAASRLLGRGSAAGAGDPEEIALGAGLTMTGTSLSAALGAAWVAWTPTWTNLTIGNAVVTGRYQQLGKLIQCRLHVVMGNTSSFTASGFNFSLPVTSISYAGSATAQPLGGAVFYDAGVALYQGVITWFSTTAAGLLVVKNTGTYATFVSVINTIPFIWGNLDELHCEFFYEAA